MPGAQRDDLTVRTGREHPRLRYESGLFEPLLQLANLGLQRLHLVLQRQDASNTREADTLFLGQPLHLPQQLHVAPGITPAATSRTGWGDKPEPVVLAKRLRVHPSQLGRDRDDVDRVVITRTDGCHGYYPRAFANNSARGSASVC